MLNLFPIQFLALLAYFLLRLFVGGTLLYLAITHLKQKVSLLVYHSKLSVSTLIATELISSGLLLFGAYTQAGALLLIAMSVIMLLTNDTWHTSYIPNRMTYVLFLGCGLSLFITGAGVFAFDLPI